jgi:hypothetical protein
MAQALLARVEGCRRGLERARAFSLSGLAVGFDQAGSLAHTRRRGRDESASYAP